MPESETARCTVLAFAVASRVLILPHPLFASIGAVNLIFAFARRDDSLAARPLALSNVVRVGEQQHHL